MITHDFVIENEGEFKRVNVKVAYIDNKNKPNSWAISAPGNPNWYQKKWSDVLDIFLVWLPHKEEFIELEGTFMDGIKSKSRIIPKYLK